MIYNQTRDLWKDLPTVKWEISVSELQTSEWIIDPEYGFLQVCWLPGASHD